MFIPVKIAKLNVTRDLEVEALPPASLAYLITYGITQTVNDAHASVQRKNFATDEEFFTEVETKVNKRWEQVVSGNVPGSRAPADPQAATVRKVVKELGGLSDAEIELIKEARAKAA